MGFLSGAKESISSWKRKQNERSREKEETRTMRLEARAKDEEEYLKLQARQDKAKKTISKAKSKRMENSAINKAFNGLKAFGDAVGGSSGKVKRKGHKRGSRSKSEMDLFYGKKESRKAKDEIDDLFGEGML